MTEPLDMSKDPDRFDAATAPSGPLDPVADPDRFDTSGRTLPQLLGEGAYEGERDNATWLWGLVGVLAFLALVSLVISQL